ncbi:MAG: DNA methyltransferase [Nannocystaceae bacterium]
MAKDPETRAHQAWLGLLQPVGLVVSPPALVKAQAVVVRNGSGLQKRLRSVLTDDERGRPRMLDFPRLTQHWLEWEAEDLVPGEQLEGTPLEVALPEHQEVLRPTYAVPDPENDGEGEGERRWSMLVQVLPLGTELDKPPPRTQRGWHASPQIRLERLLRDTEVPLGLLCTPEAIRMVYAPAGESSGHLTFPIEAMAEVPGRPIAAALHMLLCAERMFTLPPARRLSAVLVESRKYQNVVSTQLAEQVLRALGELLRGFQAADEARDGLLLGDVVRQDPQHVYGGLITVLMRLVFLLYAEEREMLPDDPVYVGHYSVGGLFEKLRADAGMYPDTMDQRYGAWARLLSLFRLVYDGGGHGGMRLPTRHGQLFSPDEYPFLVGRVSGTAQMGGGGGAGESIDPPRVSDGVVYRVLEDLLMLEGDRLSYRSLDVEQIGSVYEAVMGFEVKRATGASIGVRPQHVVVDLGVVLAAKGKKRVDAFEKDAGCKLGKAASKGIKEAETVEDVVAALGKKVSPQTPRVLPPGGLYLQPTEERRRSGSHYTPRSLTEPIVRTTLRPVLEGLGERPTAEQILGLKVCDPAMGSGAFLVEACRHLAEKVVAAWDVHGDAPEIPADEDALLHARRLVAQRCLYGVDKNPFAVNLAKLSLWLVTLARDHAFTFLDHALKCGDSLVGLSQDQILSAHWSPSALDYGPLFASLRERVGISSALREGIERESGDGVDEKMVSLARADEVVGEARIRGDLVLHAFFGGDQTKPRDYKSRDLRIQDLQAKLRSVSQDDHFQTLKGLVDHASLNLVVVSPFHWEIEYPEVFSRERPGFDAFIGNPPFGGKNTILAGSPRSYIEWLKAIHDSSHGNSDVIAHFFRRAFSLIRSGGAFGFIATNTVAQGDTRSSGLEWICTHRGTIYEVVRNLRWPGAASVIVDVIFVVKGEYPGPKRLNGREVSLITAFLLSQGEHHPPVPMRSLSGRSSVGSYVLGAGFLFDDRGAEKGASSLDEMRRVVEVRPSSADRIRPYLGGAEFNESPRHEPRRFVIDFEEMSLEAAGQWPELLHILRERVAPARARVAQRDRRELWWLHATRAPIVKKYLGKHRRCLACSQLSQHFGVSFVGAGLVFSLTLVLILFDDFSSFAVLQSRAHELWARFFGSSLEDRMRYTPSDCFETFAFPKLHVEDDILQMTGESYYTYRADLMVRNDQGLTATYNRFHDPDETSPDILKLRELHDQMDRAVLDAYGWTDIQPTCEFLLDYEEDEDEESSSRRRKPWRYRWPDEIQEEVLARLLDLNQQRAEEERLAEASADGGGKKPAKSAKASKASKKTTANKRTKRKTTKKKSATADDDGWKTSKKKSAKGQGSLPLGEEPE